MIECRELNLACPFCHRRFSHRDDDAPLSCGDYAFCKGCANVGVITDRTAKRRAMVVRKPRLDERYGIAKDRSVLAWRRHWMTRIH